MRLILASNNKNKMREMRELLADMGIEVISQSEAGLDFEVDETGTTFEENAFLKADAACRLSGEICVADDSGLIVDALDGAPGIYSARFGHKNSDDERNEYLLEKMKGVENRNAKFVSVVVCVFPNGDKIVSKGEFKGIITDAPKGENGFGYDPLFFVPEFGKTSAELTPEEKNAISHRGKAMREFKTKLREYYVDR